MKFFVFLLSVTTLVVVMTSPSNADDKTVNLDRSGDSSISKNIVEGAKGVPDDLDTAALGNVYLCFGLGCGYPRYGRRNYYYGGWNRGRGWGRGYRSSYYGRGYGGWGWGK